MAQIGSGVRSVVELVASVEGDGDSLEVETGTDENDTEGVEVKVVDVYDSKPEGILVTEPLKVLDHGVVACNDDTQQRWSIWDCRGRGGSGWR